nr:hypothetical protein Iba_chr12dCG9110 [Ipomoea batatas]
MAARQTSGVTAGGLVGGDQRNSEGVGCSGDPSSPTNSHDINEACGRRQRGAAGEYVAAPASVIPCFPATMANSSSSSSPLPCFRRHAMKRERLQPPPPTYSRWRCSDVREKSGADPRCRCIDGASPFRTVSKLSPSSIATASPPLLLLLHHVSLLSLTAAPRIAVARFLLRLTWPPVGKETRGKKGRHAASRYRRSSLLRGEPLPELAMVSPAPSLPRRRWTARRPPMLETVGENRADPRCAASDLPRHVPDTMKQLCRAPSPPQSPPLLLYAFTTDPLPVSTERRRETGVLVPSSSSPPIPNGERATIDLTPLAASCVATREGHAQKLPADLPRPEHLQAPVALPHAGTET